MSFKIHVTRMVARVEKIKFGKVSRRLREVKSSEERSKDPAIVSINAVVVNHRIILAFGRHADERSLEISSPLDDRPFEVMPSVGNTGGAITSSTSLSCGSFVGGRTFPANNITER